MTAKTYILGHHLVTFMDVLGQQDKFRELALPNSQAQHAAVAAVLADTAGFVENLRQQYKSQFEAFERGVPFVKTKTNATLTPKFIGFSDSFVTHVPLRPDEGNLARIVTIFSALQAAAG